MSDFSHAHGRQSPADAHGAPADLWTRSAARLIASSPDVPLDAFRPGPPGRILSASLALFAQKGFYGTSIREIAAAAGLRSASLYGHFASKDHILAEIILVGHEVHHGMVKAAVAASGDDPVTQLVAYVDAHVRMHAEFPVLALVTNTELHAVPSALAAPALELRHAAEVLLADVVSRGVSAGVFNPPNLWMAVAAIGGMGVRVANWYVPRAGFEPVEVAATYAEMALLIMRAT